MNYYYNLQNAQKGLKQIQHRIDLFNRHMQRALKTGNIFNKEITNMNAEVENLQQLRKHCRALMKQLDAQLKGGQKQYAKSRAERQSSSFQGGYGNLKGHNRILWKKLRALLTHIDTLISIVKSSNDEKARIGTAVAATVGSNYDQYKETGNMFDGGDPLVMAAMILVAFKKLLKK